MKASIGWAFLCFHWLAFSSDCRINRWVLVVFSSHIGRYALHALPAMESPHPAVDVYQLIKKIAQCSK